MPSTDQHGPRVTHRLGAPAAALAVALGLLVSGCSSDTSSAPASFASAQDETVVISDFAFSATSVAAGSQVQVRNDDAAEHTLTIADAGIDVKVLPGETASFTAPTRPGSYALTCDVHPAMRGTLTVTP